MPKRAEKEKLESNKVPRGAKVAAIVDGSGDAGNIDKIRDILFGNQVRDFDRRFSKAEEQMVKVTSDLREEVSKRLDAIERFFKEELSTLKDRIKTETDKRTDTGKQLTEELKAVGETMEKSIQAAEDKFSEQTTDLRQQILDQSKQLSKEMQEKYEQVGKEINRSADLLEERKIDRSAMAEYLMEVAMRLSSQQGESKMGRSDN